VDNGSCTQCQLCIERCPVEAISLKAEQIIIDEQKCLGCGFCAKGCPQEAIKLNFKGQLLGSIQDYFTRGGLNEFGATNDYAKESLFLVDQRGCIVRSSPSGLPRVLITSTNHHLNQADIYRKYL
jgi:MinD superfamily P-loop ATPase